MYTAVSTTMLHHRIKVIRNRLVLELRPSCIGLIGTAKGNRSEFLNKTSCFSRGRSFPIISEVTQFVTHTACAVEA